MGGGIPATDQRFKPAGSPGDKLGGKSLGEILRERIPLWRRAKRGQRNRPPIRQVRRDSKIGADSDNNRTATSFQQDAAQLRSANQQVVRPFKQREVRRWNMTGYDFMQGKPGEQRQTGRWWITSPQANDGRAHEVSESVKPGAALPPPPRALTIGHQPVALVHRLTSCKSGDEIGIG